MSREASGWGTRTTPGPFPPDVRTPVVRKTATSVTSCPAGAGGTGGGLPLLTAVSSERSGVIPAGAPTEVVERPAGGSPAAQRVTGGSVRVATEPGVLRVGAGLDAGHCGGQALLVGRAAVQLRDDVFPDALAFEGVVLI